MDKPQKQAFVTLRMPTELVKAIDKLAAECTRTRSGQIIALIKQAMAAKQK